MGLDPAEWLIAMRPELWYALTEVWACKYHTYRCVTNNNVTATVDAGEMVRVRDAMRSGMYLFVNGRRHGVVVDDGIYEHNNANTAGLHPGEYASDIYMIPTRVRGTPVTYFEFQDFSKTLAGVNVGGGANNGEGVWITDGGRYLVDRTYTTRCYHDNITMKPRLILRTPQLAGRVQNVKYEPLQHFRSPFDHDFQGHVDPYFVKGGTPTRSPSSDYNEWTERYQ